MLFELQKNIPKAVRYSLWARIENTCLDLLEGLLAVGYLLPEQRAIRLTQASVKVDMLRVFLRLSHDIKVIDQKKYIEIQSVIDEIGRMLGGWIKSFKPR